MHEDYVDNPELTSANEETIASWHRYRDLRVPLAVELGRTRLTVKRILELEINNIIQLTRSSGEGVDIIARGHTLARGQIVMIEDRTGVRVQDVVAGRDL